MFLTITMIKHEYLFITMSVYLSPSNYTALPTANNTKITINIKHAYDLETK